MSHLNGLPLAQREHYQHKKLYYTGQQPSEQAVLLSLAATSLGLPAPCCLAWKEARFPLMAMEKKEERSWTRKKRDQLYIGQAKERRLRSTASRAQSPKAKSWMRSEGSSRRAANGSATQREQRSTRRC